MSESPQRRRPWARKPLTLGIIAAAVVCAGVGVFVFPQVFSGSTENLTDTPPDPGGSLSFAHKTTKDIPYLKTKELYSGCPSGWYIRPSMPSWGGGDDTTAAGFPWDSKYVDHEPDYPQVNTEYPGTRVYQNVVDEYSSNGGGGGSASFTFWCDKLPSAATTAGAQSFLQQNGYSGDVASAATATPAPSAVGDDLPPSTCYMCNYPDVYLQNYGSDLYLDSSNRVGGGVVQTTTTPQPLEFSGDANGNLATEADMATFGIWGYDNNAVLRDQWAIGYGSSSPLSWHGNSTDGIPQGGQYAMVFMPIPGGGSMFIDTNTLGDSSGGQCLTSPDSAGAPLAISPCDTDDLNQMWWMGNMP